MASSAKFAALIDTLASEHEDLLPEMARLAEEAMSPLAVLKAAIDRAAPKLHGPLDEHILNEDRVLFPAYASAGGDAGVLALFTEEHREILSLRDRLTAALEDGDEADEIRSLVAQLTDILSEHMGREDEMLFPAMREAL